MTSGPRAAIASAIHFVLAPGVVVGLVPWLLTGWEPRASSAYLWPIRVVGAILVVAGVGVLVREFVRFAVEGRGSPAPPVPTERLVVSGFYRYVRNPMYVAVVSAVLGQALLLWRPVLLVYAAVLAAVTWSFVRLYEEPTLSRQFGSAYDEYRAAVPAWCPRLRLPRG
jgi:protein-S-isoprenylcysteine O-methyltransferase Ste14